MFKSLMSGRRFMPLFWCQFCSALNDNFLKQSLTMLVLFGFGTELAAQPKDRQGLLVTAASVVFIAPFFFLSALGGELADKYDKGRVAERIKFYEIFAALIAAAGFYFHSIEILFVALLAFGVLGALFGPVKYGILPENLKTEELASGNALVEGATFMAILLGTIGGGLAVTETKRPELIVGIIGVLAVACWSFARMIPHSGAAAPNIAITKNPLTSTFRLLRENMADRRLNVGSHITSWFWLVGVVAMSLLPVLIKNVLGGNEKAITASLAVFTVGIAIGSLLAAKISHEKPNLALVPVGACLMMVFSSLLALISWWVEPASMTIGLAEFVMSKRGVAALVGLFGLALAGGLYIVPAFAAVQSWAAPDKRARVIASVNVMNALYMTVAGGLLGALQAAGAPIWSLYLMLVAGTAIMLRFVLSAWGSEGARNVRGLLSGS